MTEIMSFFSSHDIAAASLLGIAIVLILTGGLVPKFQYKEKSAEAERWRLAFEIEREGRIKATEQSTELLEMAKTTNAIVKALFDTQNPNRTGDPHVVSQTQRD